MKRVTAREGASARRTSSHVSTDTPLLSPRPVTEEAPRAPVSGGSSLQQPMAANTPCTVPSPVTPCHLHNHPHGRCCCGPRSTGRGLYCEQVRYFQITQPTGGRGAELGSLSPGPWLSPLLRPHTALDTESQALMRRWWTHVAAHPAASPSSLQLQSPGFALQQQAQTCHWVKPSLALHPSSPEIFRSRHVTKSGH